MKTNRIYRLKTTKEVRAEFWENHPEFKIEFNKKKRQNDYNGDIRFAFNCFIEALSRNGDISGKLAYRITL